MSSRVDLSSPPDVLVCASVISKVFDALMSTRSIEITRDAQRRDAVGP